MGSTLNISSPPVLSRGGEAGEIWGWRMWSAYEMCERIYCWCVDLTGGAGDGYGLENFPGEV